MKSNAGLYSDRVNTKVSEIASVSATPVVSRDKRPDEEERDFRKSIEALIAEYKDSEELQSVNIELLQENGSLLVQLSTDGGESIQILDAKDFLTRFKTIKHHGFLIDLEC